MTKPTTLKKGQRVYKGQTIVGYVGNSGHVISGGVSYHFVQDSTDKTTGAHLHSDINNANSLITESTNRIAPSRFFPEINFIRN